MYELLLSIHNLKHRLIHRDVKRWHAAWKTANGARNLWPHGMGGVARMATPSVAKGGICILPNRGDGVLGWIWSLRREKRWAGPDFFWTHGVGGVAIMATPSVAKGGICILPIRGDGVLGWRRWLRREKRWAGLELFGRTA